MKIFSKINFCFIISAFAFSCGSESSEIITEQKDSLSPDSYQDSPQEEVIVSEFGDPFGDIERSPKQVYESESIRIESYDFENIEPFLHQKDNYTYVVNFWATWCKPCVAELPYFEKLRENYSSQNVHVLLVSMDFSKAVETSLIPFLKKEQLKSVVGLLEDSDANSWIPKVDENWSGAIPATIIYNKNKRAFFEKSFTYEELESELLKIMN